METFMCEGAPWNPRWQVYPGYQVPKIKPQFRIANGLIQGWMDSADATDKRQFFGVKTMLRAFSSQPTIGCKYARVSYVQPDQFCDSGVWMPSSGTWVVSDELTGRPGRGLSLDIQGSSAVVQVFNYLTNGKPAFHMGSGRYDGNADVPMDRYGGGRYFGSGVRDAQFLEHAGIAQLSFYHGSVSQTRTKFDRFNSNALESGVVTFPGEKPAKIQRLQLEAKDSLADKLFGVWLFILVFALLMVIL